LRRFHRAVPASRLFSALQHDRVIGVRSRAAKNPRRAVVFVDVTATTPAARHIAGPIDGLADAAVSAQIAAGAISHSRARTRTALQRIDRDARTRQCVCPFSRSAGGWRHARRGSAVRPAVFRCTRSRTGERQRPSTARRASTPSARLLRTATGACATDTSRASFSGWALLVVVTLRVTEILASQSRPAAPRSARHRLSAIRL